MKKFYWAYDKVGNIKPVVIDGFLYIVIAVCGIITAVLTSKEVYEYMNPYFVFYGKFINEIIGGAAAALKMYRSTSYSDHRASVDAKAALTMPDSQQTITQQQTTTVETVPNQNLSNTQTVQP